MGCLAKFPSGPFLLLAFQLFGRKWNASLSGSRAYWRFLNLMQSANRKLEDSERKLVESLELEAVASAHVYEDVAPALAKLQAIGIKLLISSSLSGAATSCFLNRYSLKGFFSAVWNRGNSSGVKPAPPKAAIASAFLPPEHVMFLVDALEGLKIAQTLGVHSVLLMNDPDEAMRLTMHNLLGGIVSLYELPDFLRLVTAENSSLPAAMKVPPSGPAGL